MIQFLFLVSNLDVLGDPASKTSRSPAVAGISNPLPKTVYFPLHRAERIRRNFFSRTD